MPLRPLTTSLHPDTLLDDSPSAQSVEEPWWVLHTKPRAEKVLAAELLRCGAPFFLPLHERRFRHHGQALVSQLPLFPGYLFVRGDTANLKEVVRARSVVRSIPVADQAGLHQDLRRLHQLILSGLAVTPEERLRPGMAVEVTGGPLKGLQGKVIREGGLSRFVVEVNFLCRGASCILDAWTLRPLEPTASTAELRPHDLEGAGAR